MKALRPQGQQDKILPFKVRPNQLHIYRKAQSTSWVLFWNFYIVKMKVALLILASLHLAAGFPWVMDSIRNAQPNTNQKRDEPNFTVRDPAFLSGRKNTGASDPNPTFNATAQYVDVRSGSGHEFQKPGLNDKRGPCPGLNAAANHNFIPRNGILTTQQGKELMESWKRAPCLV